MGKYSKYEAIEAVRLWEKDASAMVQVRDMYREHLRHDIPEDLQTRVDMLGGLLVDLPRLAVRKGLYPDVQQDLYARATLLFDKIMEQALPRKRGNAMLPSPEEVDALVREAKWLIGTGLAFKIPWSFLDNNELSKIRRYMVELWVRGRAPLSAKDSDIKAAEVRCLDVLARLPRPQDAQERHHRHGKKAHLQEPKAQTALELVAALLDSTPGSIKKRRAQRKKK